MDMMHRIHGASIFTDKGFSIDDHKYNTYWSKACSLPLVVGASVNNQATEIGPDLCLTSLPPQQTYSLL